MKVLFIAYQFPPLNVGGSHRPYKFAKYLPDFGIELTVFSLDPADYKKVYQKPDIDNSLLEVLDDKVAVEFVKSEDLMGGRKNSFLKFISIFFNIYRGSEGKYWKKNLEAKVAEVLRTRKFDLLFVTAPPFSILPIAKNLSSKYNLPMVVDMRDAWSLWVSSPYSNYFNFLQTKKRERETLNYASKVIVTSLQTIEDFKILHPNCEESKFAYIPNGYDDRIEFYEVSYEPKDKIKIGYVGSFYYSPEARDAILQPFWKKKGHRMLQFVPRKEDWLYRSPFFFLKSIKVLLDNNSSYKEKVEIHFAGNKPEWLDKMILDLGLENIVHHAGFLNHKEIINFQSSCDFLLLTSSKVIGGRDYSIAGKTFEYFTLGKPILGFVSEGAQKDLLENSGMSVTFNPENTDENAEKLENLFSKGVSLKINRSFLSDFHRRKLTQKLSEVFKEIASIEKR
jgi:glycosyltransferase involved in cell wall biosynthesis